MAPTLLVSLEHGIKPITFNRPEHRNAVDHETIELLYEAITASAADASRVVILTGAAGFEAVHQDACVRSPDLAHAVSAFTSARQSSPPAR